jgi:hypothetical protein
MKTNYSRRDALAVAVLAMIDAAMASTSAQAQTPAPGSGKAPAGKPKAAQGSAVKTRKASCTCGQLTLTTVGPDPEQVSLCHCKNCQKQTGSAFSIQATCPKEQVTIGGKSAAWKFPVAGAKPVAYRNCSRTGVTFHFCPTCGSTVYYVLDETPNNIGIKVGTFTDPTFPAPNISGFEEYRLPWSMNVAALPMPGGHHT